MPYWVQEQEQEWLWSAQRAHAELIFSRLFWKNTIMNITKPCRFCFLWRYKFLLKFLMFPIQLTKCNSWCDNCMCIAWVVNINIVDSAGQISSGYSDFVQKHIWSKQPFYLICGLASHPGYPLAFYPVFPGRACHDLLLDRWICKMVRSSLIVSIVILYYTGQH